MRTLVAIGIALALSVMSGCASIVSGTNQPISVDTPGCEGASCQLTNDKGTWFVKTPGSVTVSRAYGPLTVVCSKDGSGSASAPVTSSTKAMAFGNIILGGVIGVAVDVGTGAAYDYPPTISIPLNCAPALKSVSLELSGAPPAKPRSRFGVRVEDVSQALATSLGLPDTGGALVTQVQPGSPAEVAGMKVGDVIRDFDGVKLNDTADLATHLGATKDGATIVVRILSNGQAATLQVRLSSAGDL